MYLYVLDQKSFNKLNKENNTVIIGVMRKIVQSVCYLKE